VLPHQEASYVRHIALDIGGSLIKLVYFSPDNPDEANVTSSGGEALGSGPGTAHHHKGHHHSKGGGCGGWQVAVGGVEGEEGAGGGGEQADWLVLG